MSATSDNDRESTIPDLYLSASDCGAGIPTGHAGSQRAFR